MMRLDSDRGHWQRPVRSPAKVELQSWIVRSSFGGEAGGWHGSGTLPGAPSTDTMGKLETLTVPYWLVKVSEPPLPCCCETPLISWSSVS
jgi:hypothetical protein